MTGWGQPADRETAQAAGFDAHLVKPVPVEELLAALHDGRRHVAGEGTAPIL